MRRRLFWWCRAACSALQVPEPVVLLAQRAPFCCQPARHSWHTPALRAAAHHGGRVGHPAGAARHLGARHPEGQGGCCEGCGVGTAALQASSPPGRARPAPQLSVGGPALGRCFELPTAAPLLPASACQLAASRLLPHYLLIEAACSASTPNTLLPQDASKALDEAAAAMAALDLQAPPVRAGWRQGRIGWAAWCAGLSHSSWGCYL